MKNVMRMLSIISLSLAMMFLLSVCGEEGGDEVQSLEKFQAIPFSGTDKERIKYSFTYNDLDFYYIYLGELKNIPLFNFASQYHDGSVESTYTVAITEEIKNSTSQIITNSSETVINIIDEHTTSTTTIGKASAQIVARFPIKIVDIETKIGAERYWNEYTSNNSSAMFQQTTSLTNTVEHATSYARTTMQSRTFYLTKDNNVGYYRYTMFSDSDVYLYIIKDPKTGKIDYDFKEHVIPDSYFWHLDYSETSSFSKNDDSDFKLDISILNNLSKPSLILDSIQANFIPNTPTGLEWPLGGGRERPPAIYLKWSSVFGATGYYIYRSLSASGPYTRVGASTTNSYKDIGLSESTSDYYCYYKVSAYNNIGESSQSSYVETFVSGSGLHGFGGGE